MLYHHTAAIAACKITLLLNDTTASQYTKGRERMVLSEQPVQCSCLPASAEFGLWSALLDTTSSAAPRPQRHHVLGSTTYPAALCLPDGALFGKIVRNATS